MPFDLRISMTGLGLFTHDRAGKKVHFLMPTTASAAKHRASLVYDTAYSSAQLPLKKGVGVHSIEDQFLDLSSFGSGDLAAEPLHPAIFNLSKLVAQKINPDAIRDDKKADHLAARVTIAHGAISGCDGRAQWVAQTAEDVDASIEKMAYLVEWTIKDIDDDKLDLKLKKIGTPEEITNLPRLFPLKKTSFDRNTIHIWILNLPTAEMPPFGPAPRAVVPPQPPPHLHLAYRLIPGLPAHPLIRFTGLGAKPQPSCAESWPVDRPTSSEFSDFCQSVSSDSKPSSTHHDHEMSGTNPGMVVRDAAAAANMFGDEYTCAPARADI